MLENINLAFQGVWSHKLRSFLTMLGIIIGIAAIITIVSTIQGTNEQIKQNLIGAGNDMVQVQLTQDGSTVDFSYGELPEGIARLREFYSELGLTTSLRALAGTEPDIPALVASLRANMGESVGAFVPLSMADAETIYRLSL